jgi:TonB-linked SusC/RagA family outer membrane protein
MCALCSTLALAQQRTITGSVLDPEGEPLIGANILAKGTTFGTATDIDGSYELTVNGDVKILIFSYTGFSSQEVALGISNVVDVTLTEGLTLSEAIVTALGIEKSDRSVGYAVEEVKGDLVQQKSEPDVLRSLSGKVPGVQISGSSGAPGSATRITIRGSSSFLGSNDPLFVVDGIPYDNTQYSSTNQLNSGAAYGSPIANIDPNNIESMSVLKGAAAAALYGSRASNGVIVITTKTGNSRASQKGLEVSFSSSYSVEQITGLPDYQNTYGNGADFLYSNANGSWGPAFSGLDSFPTWTNYTAVFPELGASSPYVAQPNNVSNLFQNGHVIENSVSISSGGENARIAATFSHLDQEGYIPFSGFDRTSISVGSSGRLANGLIVNGSLSYTRSNTNGPFFGESGSSAPDAGSSFARTLWLGRGWNTDLPFENPANNRSIFFNTNAIDHPLWSWKHNGMDERTDRIGGKFSLGYDITDNINVTYAIGTNQYTTGRQLVWDIGSIAYSRAGAIVNDDISFEEIESNLLLTYDDQISNDFSLRATVGHNLNQRTVDRQAVLGTTIVSPGIFDIDNTNSLVPNGGTFSKRRLIGAFYDVTVGYNNYLFLNTTGRNDWSSTLPADSRSFFYPSVSMSAVLTEALNIDSRVLTNAKLRASWAKVGNDAPVYSLSNTFNVNLGANTGLIGSTAESDFPFNGQPGITQSNVAADPRLTPEFTTEIELGGRLEFFYGRIDVDFSFYKRNSTDQIANISIPSATGYEQLTTNFGDLQNKGIEVGLHLIPIKLRNSLTWDIYTNFTKNESEVISLLEGVERINIRNLFGGGIRPVLEVGQPYGALYGTQTARDEEGNLLIDPNNGALFPSLKDNGFGIIGDPNPDFTLGVSNTVSFKNFSLSFLIDYRHGGSFYSTSVERLLGRGVVKDTEDREPSRIIPGVLGNPNTGEPILDENGNKIPNTIQITTNDLFFQPGNTASFFINGQDDASVFDGTVVRLREISFGYTFPDKLLEKTPFGRASLTFTGRNLWHFAPNIPHSLHLDPERNGFGATNTQGIEYATAPQSKRYGVNLNVTF